MTREFNDIMDLLNTTKLEDVIGCAQYLGKKKSQAEMDAGILREAKLQVAAWSQQEE